MDDLDRIYRRLVHNIRTKYPQYLSSPFSAEELYQVIVPYRHNRQELGIDTNQDYEMALMRLLSGERGYVVVDRDVREALTREIESSNPDTSLFRAFNDRMVSVAPDAMAGSEASVARSPDDARIAAPMAEPRSAGSTRPASGSRSSSTNRGRGAGLGVPPSPNAGVAIPVAGMPLTPVPPRSAAAPSASFAPPPEPVAPPVPTRPAAPIRLAPSNAPTTSNPASGKAVGLTGHGSSVPAASSMGIRGGVSNSPGFDMAAPRRSVTSTALGGRCRYCSGTLPDGRQITFCPHCGQDLTVQQCPACSTELELGWKFCTTCGRGVAQARGRSRRC
jgi:hypothetical protein